MKCAWHGVEACLVARVEDAVREFTHDHDAGICKPECYGCFIILEAKKDVEAAVASANLQLSEVSTQRGKAVEMLAGFEARAVVAERLLGEASAALKMSFRNEDKELYTTKEQLDEARRVIDLIGRLPVHATRFTGIAKCPQCGTEGLMNESGVIETPQFYTMAILCEVCKPDKRVEEPRDPEYQEHARAGLCWCSKFHDMG